MARKRKSAASGSRCRKRKSKKSLSKSDTSSVKDEAMRRMLEEMGFGENECPASLKDNLQEDRETSMQTSDVGEDDAVSLQTSNVLMTEKSIERSAPLDHATEASKVGKLALKKVKHDPGSSVVPEKSNEKTRGAYHGCVSRTTNDVMEKEHSASSKTTQGLMAEGGKEYVTIANEGDQRPVPKVDCAAKTSVTRKRKNRRACREGPRSNKSSKSDYVPQIVLALEAAQMDSKRGKLKVAQHVTNVGSVTKSHSEVSADVGLMFSAKVESLLETADVDLRKKPDVSPENIVTSNEVKSKAAKRSHRRRKRGNNPTNAVTCPSSNIVSPSSLSFPEIVESGLLNKLNNETFHGATMTLEEKEKANLSSDISNTGTLHDMNDSEIVEGNNSHVRKKRRRKRKKKVFECSKNVMEVDGNCSHISSPLVELVGKDNAASSVRNDHVLPVGIENNGLTETADAKSYTGSNGFPHVCHTSFQEEDPSSVHITARKQTDKTSNRCVYPSPIRGEGIDERLPALPERTLLSSTRKKLLVLDLNGLLADIVPGFRNTQKAFTRIRGKSVFKRPFCDDFLKFCFERFDIGVWSSRKRCNVDDVVNYLMGEAKDKLLFCWDLTKCRITRFKTLEDKYKPLVLKELKKIWNREGSDLPWKIGDYSPSNTLLVDDSPYKALRNPPHTAIFPQPYRFNDESDNSLGPGGDLRVYLEGLAMADDVQQYVEQHPFGQPAITASHPSWNFFGKVVEEIEKNSAASYVLMS